MSTKTLSTAFNILSGRKGIFPAVVGNLAIAVGVIAAVFAVVAPFTVAVVISECTLVLNGFILAAQARTAAQQNDSLKKLNK